MDALYVFFGQTLTGTIYLDDHHQFSFQYSDGWLKTSDAFPLSISLPLQEAPFPDIKARPFFANLLPESAVRALISRRLKISEKDDFLLLKLIGGECAGAFTILPEGAKPESYQQYAYQPLSSEQIADLIGRIPFRPLLAGEDGVRISLAGAQEKLVLFQKDAMFFIPLNGAPGNCIIKPGMTHFPFSIENEYFCISLARGLNLSVPFTAILEINGQKALMIQRYDRIYEKSALTRLHQEDFCQALGISHDMKYETFGGPTLKKCFDLVRDRSANPIKDIQQLLKWVFFNYLIGNMDAHAKNLSFLYHGRQIRLAPFYDLLCTDMYEGLTHRLAMKIGGESRPEWIMEKHWEVFAKDIKISPSVLKNHLTLFCRECCATIEFTFQKFTREKGPCPFVEKIVGNVRKRSARLMI